MELTNAATRAAGGAISPALALLATALFALPASAQERLDGTSATMDPRGVGMAGTGVATSSSTSGLYLNPATIAMAHLYHLNLMYQFTGEEDLHMGGLAIVDSVTSSTIAAGASLNYLRANQTRTDHESWDARLAIAGNFGEVFFLGMTGRYLRVEHDLQGGNTGPNGRPSLPASGSKQMNGFTFDAGAAVRIARILSIGVTGYNLSDTDSVHAPLRLGTGVGIGVLDMLLIEADLILDFSSHDKVNEEIRGGAELLIAGRVPVRLGYVYDVLLNMNSIAAGIGYMDSAFAIDFGFQQELVERGRFQLAFGIRIFIG